MMARYLSDSRGDKMSDKDKSATFVLYKDWRDVVEDLTDEELGKLFRAILDYVNDCQVESFDGRTGLGVAFKTIRKQIDVNCQKYEQVVEKRRKAAQKRWGKQGASMQMHNLHMQNDAKITNANFAMHNDNVNDNDNGNGNGNVNETDNDNDNDAFLLTEEQRFDLVGRSSVESVETYISKILKWEAEKNKKCKDVYGTISKWIDQDKAKGRLKDDTPPSYDLNEYESFARSYDFSDAPWNAKEG